MSTAPYVAAATILDRIHARLAEWVLGRRMRAEAEWLDRLENTAILAGVIPAPEVVQCPSCDGRGVHENDGHGELWLTCTTCEGLGVVDAALVEPDLHEETKPVDVNDCGRCQGQGMYVGYDERTAGWAVCGWCAGTGQRGAA